jgi:hypothetical protein
MTQFTAMYLGKTPILSQNVAKIAKNSDHNTYPWNKIYSCSTDLLHCKVYKDAFRVRMRIVLVDKNF